MTNVCGATWTWVGAAPWVTRPWQASSNASPPLWTCPGLLWPRDSSTVCSPGSQVQTHTYTQMSPSLHISLHRLSCSVCPCVSSGLRELRVTGLSWSCLSALVSPTLPYLRLLDLRWCEGITDSQIKEIITPPGQLIVVVTCILLGCTKVIFCPALDPYQWEAGDRDLLPACSEQVDSWAPVL